MILRSIEILLGVLANRHGRCRTWLLDESPPRGSGVTRPLRFFRRRSDGSLTGSVEAPAMALASTDRAFEELYTRHREALARYCRALVQNEHDARDVLQNVAVRVLSCEAIRSILSHPDGRRRRTRTVRAHLRGCEGCREWARRRGKRTGIGAFLPAPIATLARWLQPILGSDPGTAALAMRTPGIGAARTIGLIASLAAGTAGLGAGGAQSHWVAPASRAVPAPTQAHVTQRRWVATAPGASYVSSRPVVELRPTATGPAVAYSAARAAAHTE